MGQERDSRWLEGAPGRQVKDTHPGAVGLAAVQPDRVAAFDRRTGHVGPDLPELVLRGLRAVDPDVGAAEGLEYPGQQRDV